MRNLFETVTIKGGRGPKFGIKSSQEKRLGEENYYGEWLYWGILNSTNILNTYFVPDTMQSVEVQRWKDLIIDFKEMYKLTMIINTT